MNHSYNSLYVPLDIGTWSCELVPANEYRSPSGNWLPFMKGDELKQLEDDRRTFDRYFRPNYDFRQLIATDIDAVRSFMRDQLNVVHWEMPTNNAGIERILKHAVRDGWLVPVVNRDRCAQTPTFRPAPAPLYWGPTRNVSGGGGGSGAIASTSGKSFHQMAMDSMGLDAEGAWGYIDQYNAMVGRVDEMQAVRASMPIGDAQPFKYTPDTVGNDVTELAARGLGEAAEAECDAIYDAEMMACFAAGAMYRDPRTYALCKERAFQNYQACRGYS
ncbi:hypothetical protein FAZ69_19965 [Trinickia terrae]|uniref:Uncharacterized protein n=1 Tax=Trinickia terrae TaxID=2571161 RepID=A0A4U1I1A9_9BURK|nr:hypothetical protein [Trinickia terrae]TKC86908.1 hypothetical protein FAZ69_19965 [Trinickia terrae]